MNRTAFETWISAPPFEREIKRFGADETTFAWPGQYVDKYVQIAWLAWLESARDRLQSSPGPDHYLNGE